MVNYTNTTTPMGNVTGFEVIWEAFKLALRDLVYYLPTVFLAVIVIALYIILTVVLNSILRKILAFLRVDELTRPLIKQLYIRLSTLIIFLVDLGIAILAIYTIILIVAPQYIEYANYALYYAGRIASIIFIILLSFLFLNLIVGYIRLEAKLRGFMFLILLFITLILVIDIAQLSTEVKTALAWGIGIGLTALITVFSIWFFFHEILEARATKRNP